MNIKQEIMLLHDSVIGMGGLVARAEIEALCEERGVEESLFGGRCDPGHEEAYLAICKEVYAKWHTADKFKVGDKVYVDPGKPYTVFKNYIRATVTETGDPKWGYHLRAFKQDLPGIFMFNVWDVQLLPRTDKSNKPLPED